MMFSYYATMLVLSLVCCSCSTGNLKVIANIDGELKEASALELANDKNILWTVEDSGNSNILYRLNNEGNIDRSITVVNAKNKDWEDLTTDKQGNIYIGDFGNNNKKRDMFSIYKILNPNRLKEKTMAELIRFTLPNDMKPEDFEAFFLYKNHFYVFSKEDGKGKLVKVPNVVGTHKASFVTKFKLKGKHTEITSADISTNGKTVVLLNHDKLWKLSGFTSDNFFNGKVESLDFKHKSQKEGICFVNNNTVLINDERQGVNGGNIYVFKLNR